ncbi:PEPxxWA-CTERM sorting domain-containing protein [Sphingomonas nostoxanthinifaciens]|uniref:PEPxxWA-CTERM sorting domain-containing protein n=1 Tax=Sphingomonas nostoxanthinifaciens TaxID=2872652 RepID=UPI001CC20276|nr:PEPxxWA-CTERM sorting domain-containing protein [Sphingomonas nostoxanthinifaciens]UAK24681.1 PEPxxWA-CTERM sorting domain-containing protein [Sphingomonas nostoxanthinifaciens]
MNRLLSGALALGLAAVAALTPSAASATSFDFTKYSSGNTFTVDGLTVKVTAWHANDSNTSANSVDSISAATLGVYQGAGLGDLYGTDKDSNGTHQIDNVGGGADFLMLQFSQDVSLNSISRNVYSISGATCCDSDAAYWGDIGNLLGSPSSSASIDLTKYVLDESTFTSLAGGKSASTTALSDTGLASVWLVSAAFNQSNDAFKLSGISVSPAPISSPAPEPASWAMMIVGFGAVGAGMRSRRRTLAAA